MRPDTLLGVWAHPDDEAYLTAGLMDEVRRAGGRVVVVNATAGEHGTDDPATWPPDRLAARRREEQRASLGILGVTEHRELGYPDGGCATYDGADAIADLIAEIRPDTIVTFGPDGMTGHPDHRAVSAWTTRAWQRTRQGRLWYATLTPEFHREWGHLNEEVRMWSYTHAPPSTPVADLSRLLRLDGPALDRKIAALRAHASQTDGLANLVGESTFRAWWSTEAFVAVPRAGWRAALARGNAALAPLAAPVPRRRVV